MPHSLAGYLHSIGLSASTYVFDIRPWLGNAPKSTVSYGMYLWYNVLFHKHSFVLVALYIFCVNTI